MRLKLVKSISLFFCILLIAAALYFSVLSATESHENVHQIIFRSYGIDSYVEYNYYFPFNSFTGKDYIARTIPYNSTDATIKCTELCKMQHNYNEIVGYSYINFLGAIAMFLIVLVFIYSILSSKDVKQYIKIEKNYNIKKGVDNDGAKNHFPLG